MTSVVQIAFPARRVREMVLRVKLIDPVRHPGPVVGPLLHLVGKLWLKATGWKIEGVWPDTDRGVFIAAPHTSNWDLAYTLSISWAMRVRVAWVGKKELFRFPMGPLMRALGGVAVDRSKRGDFVKQTAETLASYPGGMYLLIAPSGTRSRRDHWKSGFYHIAREADVPLLLGYLDYARRRGGVGALLKTTGNVREDMNTIRAFYETVRGKYPEQTSTPRLAEEDSTP